jgi:predicted ATPase
VSLIFQKIALRGYVPAQAINTVFLLPNNWDDFGHKTLFSLTVFDDQGQKYEVGNVKIAFVGQNGGWAEEQIPQRFDSLPNNFFSLGQDADYYKNIVDSVSAELVANLLSALGDVVHDPNRLQVAENEGAFTTSLLRSVSRPSIDHQFGRILSGDAALSEFDFYYEKAANERYSGIKIEFTVEPNTKPPSNIHILIGRNGVGKTTLLNNMVDALLPNRGDVIETGQFAIAKRFGRVTALHDDYFAGVVSVSFSAFDPFKHPDNQTDASLGMRYHYVGLRKYEIRDGQRLKLLKSEEELAKDFTTSLKVCLSLIAKRDRWLKAVRTLESDINFAEMNLCELVDVFSNDLSDNKRPFAITAAARYDRMSSGHAIVLLTMTKLIETVEEKTLVLLDEPESHLHPPLLSAFTRALSDLLINRNGVAIVATHSPVVLQEVPKSCVSILRRTRLILNVDRPESETFAENVGVLTREVFGLEVSKSGFHDLLAKSVDEGKSFDDIEEEYQYELGFEGRAILRSMTIQRDLQNGTAE